MNAARPEDASASAPGRRSSARVGATVPVVDAVREGRAEPFLRTVPTLSSSSPSWRGVALESYRVPAVSIPRHEHPDDFLHIVLRGSVGYHVRTGGRDLRFQSRPGTIFLLPRGTVDEVHWEGPTARIAMAIHPRLLTGALEETAHRPSIELTEHWDLVDRHISALVQAMMADLEDGSPAGALYGESLADALAVYLLRRYAVRRPRAATHIRGLPPYRLKRVLDFIGDSLDGEINLSQLAGIAGLSPHYFAEMFRQSTGRSPHDYVLSQRMERAKQHLRDPRRSITDAALEAGFQNPSHFARTFRRLEGASPSRFRADNVPRFAERSSAHHSG